MIENINWGTRDLSVPQTHWRDIPDFEIPKEGKVVLLIPGGTVRKQRWANGCIKRFKDTMGDLLDSDVSVFCAYYDDDGLPNHRLRELKKAKVLNDIKASFPDEELPLAPDFSPLFQKLFMPILLDENKKQRSVAQICADLNRVILVSYCYGGFVSYELARLLDSELKHLKFSTKDRTKVCKAFKVVACASRFPMQVTKSTILHVFSYSDKQKEYNWKYSNFHSYLNTKKAGIDKGALISLRQNEVVLTAERLLSIEIDDHHYRAYFKDYSKDFDKTEEWKNISTIMCEYIRYQLLNNGTKSVSEILNMLTNKIEVSKRISAGKKMFFDFKKHLLEVNKLFFLQESMVLNHQVNELSELLKKGVSLLPLKNKSGDFLIHQAIEQNDMDMLRLIIKNEPNWFQLFNAKKETSVWLALKQKNVDMAFLMWETMSCVQLPTFESHKILRNIRCKVFKGVLLHARKVPEASLLLDKIFSSLVFLPFEATDVSLILRHLYYLKNKKDKQSLFIQRVLKKGIKRMFLQNETDVLNVLSGAKKRYLSQKLFRDLSRS